MNWEAVKKPDFFLVGAAKSGTTALSQWLATHPEIYISPIKEPNFFSTDILELSFSKGYRSTYPDLKEVTESIQENRQIAFINEESVYQKLFSFNKDVALAGECSTSYLFSEDAARNIAAFNSQAKIIMILRNPIERAYSHYIMAMQLGLEKGGFREAFERDLNRPKKGWGVSELYKELGEYATQLKRYLDYFPRKNIRVILFEDWLDKPKETQESLCEYLNVSIFARTKTEAINVGQLPKYPRVHRAITQSGLKGVVKKLAPEGLLKNLKDRQYKSEKGVLAPEDRLFLKDIYQSEIEELQNLINRDLSNWLK